MSVENASTFLGPSPSGLSPLRSPHHHHHPGSSPSPLSDLLQPSLPQIKNKYGNDHLIFGTSPQHQGLSASPHAPGSPVRSLAVPLSPSGSSTTTMTSTTTTPAMMMMLGPSEPLAPIQRSRSPSPSLFPESMLDVALPSNNGTHHHRHQEESLGVKKSPWASNRVLGKEYRPSADANIAKSPNPAEIAVLAGKHPKSHISRTKQHCSPSKRPDSPYPMDGLPMALRRALSPGTRHVVPSV
eukprot:ANDGO_00239.mRNA.1 hypothetical protein